MSDEAAWRVRREVLGDAHVDRAVARTTTSPRRSRTSSPVPRGATSGRGRASTGAPAACSRSRCSPRCAPRTSWRCTCARRCATASRRRRSARCCSTPRSTPASRRPTPPSASPSACCARKAGLELSAARRRTSCSRSSAASRSSARSTPSTRSARCRTSRASTGLTRAAARRFLLTLADLGYVRSDGRLFSLTPRVLELGYAYLSSLELPEIAEPHLERLVEEVHESSSVSVLDGDDVVYVARVPISRIMTRGDQRRHALPGLRSPRWAACCSRRATPRSGPRRCGRSSRPSGGRAGRSSTRSSRSGCARSRRRSTAATGR